MGKRPYKCYRKLQLAYTRKEYISRMMAVPEGLKKSTFGNPSKTFPARVFLTAKLDGQISAKAIESARVSLHRELRILGEENYRLQMSAYPHHCSRSHGLVGIAKAERIAKGMKQSFGRAEMRLAQIRKGHTLLEIQINDDPVAYGITLRGIKIIFKKLPFDWDLKMEGISKATIYVKPFLPKRTKEKKASGGVATVSREVT